MKMSEKWKRFWNLTARHDGFTLVELIVVIAILAILAGVAIPAYSGYIDKANEAADQQLLAAVNTAFAAACAENGADQYNLESTPEITLKGDAGARIFDSISMYEEAFKRYFAGNAGAKFKVYDKLYYSKALGKFTADPAEALGKYSDTYLALKTKYGEQIALLMTSKLAEVGATTLVTNTDEMVSWAVENNLAGMAGLNFNKALATYLGVENVDSMTEDALFEALEIALNEKVGDDSEKRMNVTANAMVLYTAKNSADLDCDALVNAWAGSDIDDVLNSPSSSTMSEAAAIYGLYLAYAQEKGLKVEGTAVEVMGAAMGEMSDTTEGSFGAWVNSEKGEAELEAYKAAMAVMAGAASDQETTSNLLVNGYTDPEIIALIEALMGN